MTIYLDHSATTPLAPEVYKLLKTELRKNFGNPSSLHAVGRQAHASLTEARFTVAKILHCTPAEIYFTSGGTETDNLVLNGLLQPGDHAITSTIEHHAILHPAEALAQKGVHFTYVQPNPNGQLETKKVLAAVKPHTRLVSLILANNEIGTVQPIAKIGAALQKLRKPPLFHTDAVQAAGLLALNTKKLGVDLMTLTAHKFYGPKGVGILFCKTGTPLHPQIQGGAQEKALRSGTENLPSIRAAALALQLAEAKRPQEVPRLRKLRDQFEKAVQKAIPLVRLNGAKAERLPGHANFAFAGIEGESLILKLDAKGICAATGSACSSRSLEPSHVLQALNLPQNELHGSVRFTLGRSTTKQDLDCVSKHLQKIVTDLRQISPVT